MEWNEFESHVFDFRFWKNNSEIEIFFYHFSFHGLLVKFSRQINLEKIK